jgi:hypothetical protein
MLTTLRLILFFAVALRSSSAETTLTTEDTAAVRFAAKTARGNPAAIDGKPQWKSSDAAVFTIAASADGLTATIQPVAPGSATVTVEADADLSSGVRLIRGQLAVAIKQAEASSVDVTVESTSSAAALNTPRVTRTSDTALTVAETCIAQNPCRLNFTSPLSAVGGVITMRAAETVRVSAPCRIELDTSRRYTSVSGAVSVWFTRSGIAVKTSIPASAFVRSPSHCPVVDGGTAGAAEGMLIAEWSIDGPLAALYPNASYLSPLDGEPAKWAARGAEWFSALQAPTVVASR